MTGGNDAGICDQKDFFEADLTGQLTGSLCHVVPEHQTRAGLVIEGDEDGAVRRRGGDFVGPVVHAEISRERRL
jgi:hypothetical protein